MLITNDREISISLQYDNFLMFLARTQVILNLNSTPRVCLK